MEQVRLADPCFGFGVVLASCLCTDIAPSYRLRERCDAEHYGTSTGMEHHVMNFVFRFADCERERGGESACAPTWEQSKHVSLIRLLFAADTMPFRRGTNTDERKPYPRGNDATPHPARESAPLPSPLLPDRHSGVSRVTICGGGSGALEAMTVLLKTGKYQRCTVSTNV